MRWVILFLVAVLATTNCYAKNKHTKPQQKATVQSWLVSNEDGSVVIGDNINEQRSIASITKLMTVMAVLDHGQDLKEKIGKFTREQLIQLAIIKSDNKAAATLCNNIPGGRVECVRYMNDKAKYLGMENTRFVEPTGLSPMNISTALDLIKMVQEASTYPEIIQGSNTARYTFQQNKKWVSVNNTNPLVGKNFRIVVSKTGTTNAAGQCLVMMVDSDKGRRVLVLLGVKNRSRADVAKDLVTT